MFSPSLLYFSYPPQNTPLSSLRPQQHYAMHQTPHATMRLQGLCGSLWRSLKLKQIHTFNFHNSLVILLFRLPYSSYDVNPENLALDQLTIA